MNYEMIPGAFADIIDSAITQDAEFINVHVREDLSFVTFTINKSKVNQDHWTKDKIDPAAEELKSLLTECASNTFTDIDLSCIGSACTRLRITTFPAAPEGYDILIRLIWKAKPMKLEDLGYSEEQVATIKDAIRKPVGATLIAGTSSSLLSTSLTSLLQEMIQDSDYSVRTTLVTEFPNEHLIPGTTAIPYEPGKESHTGHSSFRQAFCSALHSDPDSIAIHEVLDDETLKFLDMATMAGHKTFTTVHAGSMPGIISRLRTLGASEEFLSDKHALSLLIYQTAVPVTCPKCAMSSGAFISLDKQGYLEAINNIQQLFTDAEKEPLIFRNPKGCNNCHNGYTGTTLLAEVVVPDEQLREHIRNKDDQAMADYVRTMPTISIQEHAIQKIKAGICDIRDVEFRIGSLTDIECEPKTHTSVSAPSATKIAGRLLDLGYSKEQAAEIISVTEEDHLGVRIVQGSTGSHGSSSLKKLLNSTGIECNCSEIPVVTVSEPPEYFIPNATAIPVVRDGDKGGEAFKEAIKAAMKNDADTLIVGKVEQ